MPGVELQTRQTHQELWGLTEKIYELFSVRNVYRLAKYREPERVSSVAEKNHYYSQYALLGESRVNVRYLG